MAPEFNPRMPNLGVMRSIQRRPASEKNFAWRQTDYVRDPEAVLTIWNDRNTWKRSVAEWCPCFRRMDFYLIGKESGVLAVIVALWNRQRLKAWWPAEAPMQPSLHQSTPCSSPLRRRHWHCNPGSSAPAASQSCFTCCCSSPSTSQSQGHWRYGETHLPIAWSLGGGTRKIHLLWHRTERLDVEADEATFEVVRPGTTGQAWHLRTEPLASAPGQASSTRSRCGAQGGIDAHREKVAAKPQRDPPHGFSQELMRCRAWRTSWQSRPQEAAHQAWRKDQVDRDYYCWIHLGTRLFFLVGQHCWPASANISSCLQPREPNAN